MYLQKITIQGFKSFAKPIILEFPIKTKNNKKGITAIVGPNGSGKSNVADAVRWVLGEQSLKTLRGKKSADVIFSGSDKKARLGLAEVSLYLNNEDKEAPIEYSEVVITRRLYRNGESEYLINKNRVRLQDITILLAKCKFGQRTYSIIGQGMVDNFLFATPQERKEFFEEAAGIREFQIKKEQAINKFKTSRQHLQQTDMLLQEITPRVNSLTRQVKKLERRAEIAKQADELQEKYYGGLWQHRHQNQEQITKEWEAINKKRLASERDLQAIQRKLNEFKKADSRNKVFTEMQNEFQKLLTTKSQLKEKQIRLQHKIQFTKPTIISDTVSAKKILGQLTDLEQQQQTLIKQLEQIKSIDQLKKLLTEFNQLNNNFNNLIKELKPAENVNQPKIKIAQEELRKIIIQLDELENKIVALQKKMNNFNQQEEDKRSDLFNLQNEFQQTMTKFNTLTNQSNDLKVELAKVETHQEDLELEMKEELTADLIKKIKSGSQQYRQQPELLPEIQKLRKQLEFIGGLDPEIETEYQKSKERYDFLITQSADLNKALNSLENIVEELEETIKKEFDKSFDQINEKFEKYFKLLFDGGKASLIKLFQENKPMIKEADNNEEVAEEINDNETNNQIIKSKSGPILAGIDLQATPPGKKIKSINVLSGGERAMTSIALICAIIANNPSPFVVLDEVDAALDEANSLKFAAILDKLSEKTQFIVITHNRESMCKASFLYGVTMGDDGISKLLSVKLSEAEEVIRKK